MPREARAQRNTELFRQVNARIHELEAQWKSDQPVGFVCECARLGCTTPVYMTSASYGEVKALGKCFVVTPTHIDHEHERIVRETIDYAVVERLEPPGAESPPSRPGSPQL
jgi:hypothetical protein